jgi:hypothetical protein
LETDGRSRSKSKRCSALEVPVEVTEPTEVAEEPTEAAGRAENVLVSGLGAGAGRVKVCGGVLILLGCFFVIVM